MSALDTQVDGNHYKDMAIQPMEFSMANDLDACQHTIVKYVCRFRSKGGIRDLEKAKHVIDMLIGFEGQAQKSVKTLIQDNPAAMPTTTFAPLNLGLDGCSDPGCTQCYPAKDLPGPGQDLADALDNLLRGVVGNTVSLKQAAEDAKNRKNREKLDAIGFPQRPTMAPFSLAEIIALAEKHRVSNGNS